MRWPRSLLFALTACGQIASNAVDAGSPNEGAPTAKHAIGLAMGSQHACALIDDGSVWCWGTFGVNPPTLIETTPVRVDGISNATSISAGAQRTCAVVRGGNVRCWTLGATPLEVPGSSDAASITTGLTRGVDCFVTQSSGAKCAGGDNHYGLCGNGTQSCTATPNDVIGLKSGVQRIAALPVSFCAKSLAGPWWCWGDPWSAQTWIPSNIGLSDTRDLTMTNDLYGPSNVYGLSSDGRVYQVIGTLQGFTLAPGSTIIASGASALSHGYYAAQACAVLASGHVSCWQKANVPPVEVPGVTSAVAVDVAYNARCAVLASGGIRCWGSNQEGVLGDGSGKDSAIPVSVVGFE